MRPSPAAISLPMKFSFKSRRLVAIGVLPVCFLFLPTKQLNGQGTILAPNPSINGFDATRLDMVLEISQDRWERNLQSLNSSASKFDLKAPGAARREYDKGTRCLIKKDFSGAVASLTKAVAIYPSFVGAHNALGSAYLNLGQNEQAQNEFSRVVALDDHLPYCYLNLSWAQLGLRDYASAQQSLQKASALAPLDLHMLTALSYAELLNQDYAATIATALQVHGRKHEGAAIVHYFAAAAWQGENNLPAARNELEIFVAEAPSSPSAGVARQEIEKITDLQDHPPPPASVEIAYSAAPLDPSDSNVGVTADDQRVLNQFEQQRQLAEVESVCEGCAETSSGALSGKPNTHGFKGAHAAVNSGAPYTLRSTVNEVAVFFAATDHGKSVTDLTRRDVEIRDDGGPPAAILGFRNESD